jgi:hypothetical protein
MTILFAATLRVNCRNLWRSISVSSGFQRVDHLLAETEFPNRAVIEVKNTRRNTVVLDCERRNLLKMKTVDQTPDHLCRFRTRSTIKGDAQ